MMKNSRQNASNRQENFGENSKKGQKEPEQVLGQNVPIGSADYLAPESLNKALEYRSRYGYKAVVIAGGTDIMVDYFEKLPEVTSWLDLTKISALKNIEISREEIIIGSLVTHLEIARNEELKKYLPLLAAASSEVGSWQIQSRGTIGGNIVTSSPAGDTLAPLLAYQARFVLASTEGEREVAAEEFFVGPKDNIMEPQELLTKIIIPHPPENTISRWWKVGKRKAMIISSLTMALLLEVNKNDRIQSARAAYGAVAPTPLRLESLEEYLTDKDLQEVELKKAGNLAEEAISPISDIRGTEKYRRQVTRDITIEALREMQQR